MCPILGVVEICPLYLGMLRGRRAPLHSIRS